MVKTGITFLPVHCALFKKKIIFLSYIEEKKINNWYKQTVRAQYVLRLFLSFKLYGYYN